MKAKTECEPAIRALCWQWAKDLSEAKLVHPNYAVFKHWAAQNGYARYFKFRSRAGADYDAEMWFDQEFNQMWRR